MDRRPLHYWAEAHEIAGGQVGYLLLLVRCRCREVHAHHAPLTFVSGERRAPCGAVYTVHSGVQLAAVVA